MKNTMIKTTLREIRHSLGRYLAILAIVALGVGIFSGLKITKPFMVATTDSYLKEKQFYDFRMVSTYGFEEEDVAYLAEQKDARCVHGAYSYDVLYQLGRSAATQAGKVHSLTTGINELDLLAGRMPQSPSECVLDASVYGEEVIGQTLRFTEENEEDTLDVFLEKEYTVTGIANSSYYIQFERGNTSIGNGKITAFMYVLPQAFDTDIYTEIFVKLEQDFPLYSEEYEDYIEEQEAIWEAHLEDVADRRFIRVQNEAEAELADAKEEFDTEKADAEKELADAKEKLTDAEAELADAKKQIEDAAKEIRDGKAQIADGWQEITDGYAQIDANEAELEAGAAELETNKALLSTQEAELTAALTELQAGQAALDAQKAPLDAAAAELDQAEQLLLTKEQELAALEEQLHAGLIPEDQRLAVETAIAAGRAEISTGKEQIAASREPLTAGYAEIAAAQAQLDAGFAEAEAGQTQIEAAKSQMAQAEQQLEAGRIQIAAGRQELSAAEAELVRAQAELKKGEAEYEDGLAEYEDGVAEYEDGLAEYEDGLAEFEAEIADAEAEIADAEQEIADMEHPEVYLLGRDANIGYVCLESDSDIVADVSTVLPVFFFLIAALVCMTTMNRMIEEQRTQIGILKALGYSDWTIMGKYLFYSGSAAGMGCLIGYSMGCFFLSKIIWSAYGMMYDMPELVFYFDWGLFAFCFVCSMLSSVGVTYFSCRSELADVAATLMRPKSPKVGKRVFLEYIPFIWKRLSFLVKVSIRNVFRYKKRFFMMIVGISGCTGLLVTGFGVNDSISDVTTIQYNEIQIYDMSVTFREEPDGETKEELQQVLDGRIDKMHLFMESSLDLTANGMTKSVSLVVPEDPETIHHYISIHTPDGEPIEFPQAGEAVISEKIADTMDLQIGDTIELMDEDHKQFTVQISAICQNFVFNYIYLHPDTCAEKWKVAEFQTAYINMPEESSEGSGDIHQVSADLMALEEVANVTVNADVEERFNNMMSSMDFIVFVIIVSAAALAFIVLYNLTNINITERIREIATIKVLGFTKKETASYVFRENIALTAIGSVAGLFLGKVFHAFVMSCINIEMVAFDVRINWYSYIYSILLTFAFAWIVNLFMGGKLEKISMTESLKSVD